MRMPRDPDPDPDSQDAPLDVDPDIEAVATRLGALIRTERRGQDLTLATLAEMAGVSTSSTHAVEGGRRATLGMYVRLVRALDKRLVIDLGDLRGTDPVIPAEGLSAIVGRPQSATGRDIVHAAMGELEAARLLAHGRPLGIDVPWQHYRFGGRADVVTWDIERRALLQFENKSQLPDVQDALGRFNETQAYLGGALWERLGMAGPPLVETHVMVALWSAEVIDVVRRNPATFRATFPASPDPFLTWWSRGVPGRGRTTAFVLLDPFATGRERVFADLREVLAGVQPRLAGYAAAADLVRRGRPRGR